MDDEEDYVVEEIPVYISKGLQDNAFVLQYPTKKNGLCLENQEIVNCCIKPISQQVKIDFRLDTSSKNYDASKGEELAQIADGKNPSRQDRPTFSSGRMDKQSYTSSLPMNHVNRYIVGILQDNEVHATQIKNIIQMRPNYSCFDKLDKRTKTEQKAEKAAEDDDEEIKQVTVKFSRNENERIKKAREKSFNVISQRGAEEPWCETLWHPKNDSASELERQKLFSSNVEPSGHSLSLTSKEYFDSLVCIEEKIVCVADGVPTNCVISREFLRNMALVDQLKVILRDAKVLTYNAIVSTLDDTSLTNDKLIRTLPLAGILICGNWVVQSEFLYPPNSVSGINGVPADLMCRARDYILYKFSRSLELDRLQTTSIVQIPPEECLEILNSIGRLNSNKKWQFLLPPDTTFESKHQELVERQDLYWKAKEDKYLELEVNRSPKRVRKKSIRENK